MGNIKIPSNDIQLRVFGFVDPQEPVPGTVKAKAYEILMHPDATEDVIQRVIRVWRQMNKQIENDIIFARLRSYTQ